MKLPAEVKKKWLKALRSGKYTQTEGTLCDGTGYCCLGVLQDVTEGKIESYESTYDDYGPDGYRTEPTGEFWKRIGAEAEVTDKHLSQLMRMNDGGKWYDATKKKMVPTRKRSFNKIADWIDKHVETI